MYKYLILLCLMSGCSTHYLPDPILINVWITDQKNHALLHSRVSLYDAIYESSRGRTFGQELDSEYSDNIDGAVSLGPIKSKTAYLHISTKGYRDYLRQIEFVPGINNIVVPMVEFGPPPIEKD